MASSTRGSGRIHPHQRDANFSDNLLGEDLVIPGDHVETVQATEKFSIDEKTKKNHHNRIKHIYQWWEKELPDYYNVGVRRLTPSELNDTTKFWWKNKHDLIYDGINSNFVKVFIASKVKKGNGKTSSFENVRKYFDAIQFGAEEADVLLPITFYQAKDKFLPAFKKQVAKEKKNGNLDEHEADPIPMSLFILICTWAARCGNIMLHIWTILQWNLMARSVNIEPISLHNIKVYGDSIQFLYDTNKNNQEGRKTTVKHVYANPDNPYICSHLLLGIYMCLNATRFETSELLFKSKSKNEKTSSASNYCIQLKELLWQKKEIVMTYIRLAHANAHGWRKGGASYATSGTTCPPPYPFSSSTR